MSDKSYALAQGRSFARAISLIILILSIIAAVWFCIVILFHIGIGEKAINIDDSNREEISALIPDEMAKRDDYKNLDHAITITRFDYIFKGKASLTVKYDDGSQCFFIPFANDVPELSDYIKEKGYLTYLRSSEFLTHLLELSVPLIVGAACIIYRRKAKPVKEATEKRDRGSE